ncbi:MAG: ankyrin repeat domain-containing protein [Armatimonas sp.]
MVYILSSNEWVEPDTPANQKLLNAVNTNDIAGVREAFEQGAIPDVVLKETMTTQFRDFGIIDENAPINTHSSEMPLVLRIGVQEMDSSDTAAAIEVFQEFLNRGVSVTATETEHGRCVIHSAASLRDVTLLRDVVARGADINVYSPVFGTALSIVIVGCRRDKEGPELPAIQFLLENGADPNVPDSMGMLPLINIAICNHPKAAQLLLQYGADPSLIAQPRHGNLGGPKGRTALEYAQRMGNKEVAEVLISAQADTSYPATGAKE